MRTLFARTRPRSSAPACDSWRRRGTATGASSCRGTTRHCRCERGAETRLRVRLGTRLRRRVQRRVQEQLQKWLERRLERRRERQRERRREQRSPCGHLCARVGPLDDGLDPYQDQSVRRYEVRTRLHFGAGGWQDQQVASPADVGSRRLQMWEVALSACGKSPSPDVRSWPLSDVGSWPLQMWEVALSGCGTSPLSACAKLASPFVRSWPLSDVGSWPLQMWEVGTLFSIQKEFVM